MEKYSNRLAAYPAPDVNGNITVEIVFPASALGAGYAKNRSNARGTFAPVEGLIALAEHNNLETRVVVDSSTVKLEIVGKQRYYLRLLDLAEQEVDRRHFIAAERAAGFQPKSGDPNDLATSGFNDGCVSGSIRPYLDGVATLS